MKWLKKFWPGLLIFVVVLFFFFPIFKGQIPFPGDLLVGHYAPYNSNSYFGIAPGGVRNKGQDFDVIRMLLPWKEFAVKNLFSGTIPFWNPYNFSGTPFLANFQGATFYPFNLLFLLLPILPAWALYIISESLFSSLFTFFLLREFGLSKKSALFGGLVFAFSSYMVVWLEYGNLGHAALWFPLVLLLIEKQLKKSGTITYLLLIAALTLSILAGYIQITIYLFFFSFIFLIFRAFFLYQTDSFKKILSFIPAFVFPLVLSSFQLLPTAELFFYSARKAYSVSDMVKLLIPIQHVITTFVPDFFGNPATANYWLNGTYIERVSYFGVIPLFFVILAIFRKKTSVFWIFAFIGAFVYLLSFQNPVSILFYSLQIPIVGTGVPTRIMYVFCFSAAVCSAFGFESWLKDSKTKMVTSLVILGSVYLILWISVFVAPHVFPGMASDFSVSKKNLILPTGIFVVFVLILIFNKITSRKRIATVLIILAVLFDLFYFFQKITPFSPASFFYPGTDVFSELKQIQGIDRSWGLGNGYFETNFQTHEKIFSAEGYDPLFIKNYAELVSTSHNGQIAFLVPRSDVNIASVFAQDTLSSNLYRQRILNLLGVKYILNKNDLLTTSWKPDTGIFPSENYRLVWQGGKWQIYENKNSIPRFFMADNFIVSPQKTETISLIFNKNIDLRRTLILNKEPDIKIDKSSNNQVSLLSYKPDSVSFKTKTSGNSLLFLSDNYYPAWKALIDGKKSEILVADYTFRAIAIPKGKHTVEFIYDPTSFYEGLLISVLGVLSILGYGIISLRNVKT